MLQSELEERVYQYAKSLGYWWVIPRFTYAGLWEADYIAFGPRKGILEIEIKRSWADYRKDREKKTWDCLETLNSVEASMYKSWEKDIARMKRVHGPDYCAPEWKRIKVQPVHKHDWLLADYPCSWRPNYFVFAAPNDLAIRIAEDTGRKRPFGVWGFEHTDYGNGGKNYAAVQRLLKLRPWWMGQFKWDSFKRSMWAMDTYFKYELPTAQEKEQTIQEDPVIFKI